MTNPAQTSTDRNRVATAFPPGERLFDRTPLYDGLFEHVDRLLEAGDCPSGRLDIENGEVRLSCLFHKSSPYMAGVTERDRFSAVPLYDFARRAVELGQGAACSLVKTDAAQVVMIGVHFARRPKLQASTRLIEPAHLMRHLAEKGRDAAVAFELDGARTLLFLNKGKPARLYLAESHLDPGEGSVLDRLRDYAFSPLAPAYHVEVFSDLKLSKDPDAGVPLARLAASIQPAPAVMVHVQFEDGREVRQRPFTPPEMVIGRDPQVDLFIDNLAVSRRHATLRWERGELVVEDLGSANGTAVNGDLVERRVVQPGDEIQIAKFTVSLEELLREPRAPETIFMPLTELPTEAYLIGTGPAFKLEDDVVIGKGSEVDVQASGWRVGAPHARLHVEEGGSFRLGCFGRRVARVNGRKVHEARLKFGDVVEIGRSRFTLSASADSARGREKQLT